jgi:hypothetical protein
MLMLATSMFLTSTLLSPTLIAINLIYKNEIGKAVAEEDSPLKHQSSTLKETFGECASRRHQNIAKELLASSYAT